MSLQLFISALVLGLLSSFHCVGMCGAIAFSIPTKHLSSTKKVAATILYNAGRVTTYSMLGLLFGLVGRQIYVAGFQQWFSISAGCIILIVVMQSWFNKPVFHLPGYKKISSLTSKFISRFIGKPSLSNIYILGAANGLLPCGLVYLALAGALASGSIVGATGFMATFGFGTLPAMFILSYCKFIITLPVRNAMKKIVPYVIGLMGVLLIFRGLNLGIQYISPVLPAPQQAVISCH